MDRSLKERLIGAAVLVLLVVLVVPELLSGRRTTTAAQPEEPTGRELRTYTIELGGNSGAAAASTSEANPRPIGPAGSPLVVERSAQSQAEAVLPAARPKVSPPATTPVPQVAKPPAPRPERKTTADAAPTTSDKPAKATQPAARSAAGQGTWSVQVGAFGSADSARKLVRELEAAGYRVYVSPMQRSGKTLHRVRVGPEPSKAAASALAGQLKSRGLPVSLIAND